eukprot:1160353-Pelagomonas_calceolata.AAC.15
MRTWYTIYTQTGVHVHRIKTCGQIRKTKQEDTVQATLVSMFFAAQWMREAQSAVWRRTRAAVTSTYLCGSRIVQAHRAYLPPLPCKRKPMSLFPLYTRQNILAYEAADFTAKSLPTSMDKNTGQKHHGSCTHSSHSDASTPNTVCMAPPLQDTLAARVAQDGEEQEGAAKQDEASHAPEAQNAVLQHAAHVHAENACHNLQAHSQAHEHETGVHETEAAAALHHATNMHPYYGS